MSEEEITHVCRLVDTPTNELRVQAFDGGGETPTQAEANRRFAGWSKADLIKAILTHRHLGVPTTEY